MVIYAKKYKSLKTTKTWKEDQADKTGHQKARSDSGDGLFGS